MRDITTQLHHEEKTTEQSYQHMTPRATLMAMAGHDPSSCPKKLTESLERLLPSPEILCPHLWACLLPLETSYSTAERKATFYIKEQVDRSASACLETLLYIKKHVFSFLPFLYQKHPNHSVFSIYELREHWSEFMCYSKHVLNTLEEHTEAIASSLKRSRAIDDVDTCPQPKKMKANCAPLPHMLCAADLHPLSSK